jgi:hypothetical protein
MADFTTGQLIYLKMDEGSGTSSVDTMGNATVTLEGGYTWTTGRIKNGLNLDGSNGTITLTHASFMDVSNITVAMWFKPDTWPAALITLASAQANDPGNGYPSWDMRQNGPLEVYLVAATIGYAVQLSSSIVADGNTWQHVAFTFDGESLRIYYNGLEEDSATGIGGANMTASAANINVGTNPTFPSGRYFDGAVDEFRLYNRGLTASDVLALYNFTGSGPHALTDGGLVGNGLINSRLVA